MLPAIKKLKQYSKTEAVRLLNTEHPQIIATILILAGHKFAAKLIPLFTERLRNDVVLRMATFDSVNTFWLSQINAGLEEKFDKLGDIRLLELRGLKKAQQTLRNSPYQIQDNVLDNIREYDPSLSQLIWNGLYKFKDILKLTPSQWETLIKKTATKDWVVALAASPKQQKKFSKYLPFKLHSKSITYTPAEIKQARTKIIDLVAYIITD